MSLDGSELTSLARDLGMLSSPAVVEAVTAAIDQSANRVKTSWNGKLYRDGHADRTGRSISYDVGVGHDFNLLQTDALHGADGATIIAEIGPKRGQGKQAGIVRLLENGSVHNPPHGFGAAALMENEADFDAAIAFAISAAERGAGL